MSHRFLAVIGTVFISLTASTAGAENVIVVDAYQDEINAATDCIDDDPATTCSLREALLAVQGAEGDNVIELGSGVYSVTIPAEIANLGSSGWMPISLADSGSLVIRGEGPAATVIAVGDLGIYTSLFPFVAGKEFTLSGVTLKRLPSAVDVKGIRQSVGNLVIDHCLFIDNRGGLNGGAVESVEDSESLSVRRSVFLNNDAGQDGGSVYASVSGSLAIEDTAFIGSEASGDGGGAWLYSKEGPVTLRNITLDANRSGFSGGGIFLGGGESVAVLLEQSTLSRNSALEGGGAWIDAGPLLSMANVTVSGNDSVFQGAALKFAANAVADVSHLTAARNRSLTHGAALVASGGVSLRYTLWTNDGPECGGEGLPASAGYNVSEDASCQWTAEGDLQDVADFFLGPLADNGGPTQTHLLFSGSPALDVGPGTETAFDQRGIARPVDVDGDGVAHADAGAVEMETEVCDGSCATEASGGCSLLRHQ